MLDREQRVREIAHRLWEEEGRPTDQDKRHWITAEQIFDAEARAVGPQSELKLAHDDVTDARPAGTGKRKARRNATARPRHGASLPN